MGLRRFIKNYLFKKEVLKKLEEEVTSAPEVSIDDLDLDFPVFEKPLVTIIIPFYNNETYTKQCLWSIKNNLPKCSFELILIDDNSKEDVDLSRVSNIKLIKNSVNQGFLLNVNMGIREAKGEYIYLLNNDTIVHENFLDALLEVFDMYADAGAVGSMLLNADGSLQEAGSVFMKDYKISQIARIKPYYPEINYVYRVDYCSGCSLLFKKYNDKGELNLLDESFAPAYFEETDLCFNLRYKQNKQIYYTPFSRVTHFDGASYNSKKEEHQTSKTALFDRNKIIFGEKWKEEISAIQAPTVRSRVYELYNNKSIVFFHDQMPQYDTNSGELRLMEIMASFKDLGYHVSLVTTKTTKDNKYNAYYQKRGICVYYLHKDGNDIRSFMQRNSDSQTLVWLHSIITFNKYYPVINKHFNTLTTIYDMVDIHHLRLERALQYEKDDNHRLRALQRKLRKQEIKAAEQADIVIPISEHEKKYMEEYCKQDKMIVISNIHYQKASISSSPDFDNRHGLLFIGSRHQPNVDAVNFAIDQIMPLVWQDDPNIVLNIVGEVGNFIEDEKKRIDKVVFHGFVPDITSVFLSTKIMIVPLRYGAGIKGKIGQAYEFNLPVISTHIGAEGLEVTDGVDILLADDPQYFADQILRLYQNKHLWKSLQKNSIEVLKPYSKPVLEKQIAKVETLHNLIQLQKHAK